MQNQKNENLKKIIMAIIVLAMFGFSYHYYAVSKKETTLTIKDVKTRKPVVKPPKVKQEAVTSPKSEEIIEEKKITKEDKKPEQPEQKEEVKTPEIETTIVKKGTDTKIEPTRRTDLIVNAVDTSGKKDPFSYVESEYFPFTKVNPQNSGKFSKINPQIESLPAPPDSSDISSEDSPFEPMELVVIKGFIGDKVIAQIKGSTESLEINETWKGIKVLNVDPENLSCEFEIDGQIVTKTMKPVTRQDNNIKINYVTNTR